MLGSEWDCSSCVLGFSAATSQRHMCTGGTQTHIAPSFGTPNIAPHERNPQHRATLLCRSRECSDGPQGSRDILVRHLVVDGGTDGGAILGAHEHADTMQLDAEVGSTDACARHAEHHQVGLHRVNVALNVVDLCFPRVVVPAASMSTCQPPTASTVHAPSLVQSPKSARVRDRQRSWRAYPGVR